MSADSAGVIELFGLPLGTPFQGGTLLVALVAIAIWWIRGMPERRRASNDTMTVTAKIEEGLRGEAAERLREFRDEVKSLRLELADVRAELLTTAATSVQRGDKLDMVLFILRMVMDELHAKEPGNKILTQASALLSRISDEPRDPGNSNALNKAEDTVDAANATVREVKASEAKAGK